MDWKRIEVNARFQLKHQMFFLNLLQFINQQYPLTTRLKGVSSCVNKGLIFVGPDSDNNFKFNISFLNTVFFFISSFDENFYSPNGT